MGNADKIAVSLGANRTVGAGVSDGSQYAKDGGGDGRRSLV